MIKIKCIKITKRFSINLRRWFHRRRHLQSSYHRIRTSTTTTTTTATSSRMKNWCSWDHLKSKARKKLCFTEPAGSAGGYIQMGRHRQVNDIEPEVKNPVPKGHLAVYVGQRNGEFSRVIVPVIYFNHPLFGQLLKEAEEEFGFCDLGRIQIPCCYSEFEKVKTSIDAGKSCRRFFRWR